MANQSARLMVRTRGAAMVITLIVILLYVYVDYGSCSQIMASMITPAPMFVMWAAIGVCTCYWSMPADMDNDGYILQVWLQVLPC